MTEATQRWTVGEARITSVVEAQTDGIPPALFLPDADEATVRRHAWLLPHHADEAGCIGLRVQAFVVDVAGRLVVVDPCVGNGRVREAPFWHMQNWPFLDRFAAAGFAPADVDMVVHTHLHTDHLGWDTHLRDGHWVPTFPHARHIYVDAEIAARRADTSFDARHLHADAIAPIFDAGLADVVEADADLGSGLRLASTPGHTPGHASLWLTSGTDLALVTGDVLHHPVQCAEPALSFVSDDDPATAEATRRATLAAAVDTGAFVLGTHFPTEPGGRVVVDGAAWRFVAERGAPVPAVG